MQSEEIRNKFLDFFEERGHTVLSSVSLVPHDDPSVLFTTAGVQPIIPYLLKGEHPLGPRLASVQKCVRMQDIDEIGDNTHDTFFEMLGNWSIGDYFKETAIKWTFEFLTDEKNGLGLDKNRLYVTVFAGNDDAPRDEESKKIWVSLGIPENRIYYLKDNWWSVGDNGPCGADTEIFYDLTADGLGDLSHEEYIKADERQDLVEIGNNVFMEYEKKDGKVIGKLKNRNVDFGGGLERQVMAVQGKNNIFDTDLFEPIMDKIEHLWEVVPPTPVGGTTSHIEKAKRVVADHIRTAVFIISDGVTPSNIDRGYVLRRLIRRSVIYSDILGIEHGGLSEIVDVVIHKYENIYKNVKFGHLNIANQIEQEERKFRLTLNKGLKEFNKIKGKNISGKEAFVLFTTYGFPIEIIIELANKKGVEVDVESFRKEMENHKKLSQSGSDKKFKGGLLDASEKSIKYHTAMHLLYSALRAVLGDDVLPKGNNITPDRLRMDFAFPRKLTDEEKKQVEDLVNKKIKESMGVSCDEMSISDARNSGALGVFNDRYGEKVKVYSIGDFSKEICGGPHVKNTKDLGVFKITNESASSSGVRRVKAVLE
jgi:alanyl-tRNA synthetase